MEYLLDAVRDKDPWLARFRKNAYPDAFREYRETYGALFAKALEDLGPEALAESLLDGWEADQNRRRRWSRTAARMDQKQMLVVYLTPMLLETEDPDQAALAEALQRGWAARWPGDGYELGRFEDLQRGFRTTILGIPVGDPGER